MEPSFQGSRPPMCSEHRDIAPTLVLSFSIHQAYQNNFHTDALTNSQLTVMTVRRPQDSESVKPRATAQKFDGRIVRLTVQILLAAAQNFSPDPAVHWGQEHILPLFDRVAPIEPHLDDVPIE